MHRGINHSLRRYALGTLLAFGALNAFGGGWYGMSGAPSVPREWLRGTPFSDYFLPSAILFFVVGGTLLFGAVATFARLRIARAATLFAAFILLVWIATQVAMIGYVSWMQPVTALGGVVILSLALGSGDARKPPTSAPPANSGVSLL